MSNERVRSLSILISIAAWVGVAIVASYNQAPERPFETELETSGELAR